MKRHTTQEIDEKLRQADMLAGRGQSQGQICKSLGVSVMTFHRWRKQAKAYHAAPASFGAIAASIETDGSTFGIPDGPLIQKLQLENRRLRMIVTDLLLEKAIIEEAIEKRSTKTK